MLADVLSAVADYYSGGTTTVLPNGVARLGNRQVVATATDADRNTSEYSLGTEFQD